MSYGCVLLGEISEIGRKKKKKKERVYKERKRVLQFLVSRAHDGRKDAGNAHDKEGALGRAGIEMNEGEKKALVRKKK